MSHEIKQVRGMEIYRKIDNNVRPANTAASLKRGLELYNRLILKNFPQQYAAASLKRERIGLNNLQPDIHWRCVQMSPTRPGGYPVPVLDSGGNRQT